MTQTKWKHIQWTSHTTRVNIDTGEVITEHQSKQLLKLKTKKNVKISTVRPAGTIEYTIEYTRNPQTKCEF